MPEVLSHYPALDQATKKPGTLARTGLRKGGCARQAGVRFCSLLADADAQRLVVVDQLTAFGHVAEEDAVVAGTQLAPVHLEGLRLTQSADGLGRLQIAEVT